MHYNEDMSVAEIELPTYTRNQEDWNCASHALGVIFAVIGGPFLIVKAALKGDPWEIVSCSIFVLSLILLYTFSSLYHGLQPCNAKRVLRVMDHDMVFVLIMGTYTPYCLVALRTYSAAWCWTIYGLCLVLGVLGIVLNSCNIKKFAIFNFIDYILMGWLIAISFYSLIAVVGWWPGIFLLLLGGVLYSIGAVLYAIGKSHSFWWHTIFHFFVLAGTMAMFFSLYFYVI
jgi:hemolysin III